MDLAKVVVVTLLALQFLAASHRAEARNPLAPLLGPLFDNMCNRSFVSCGRGTCEESSDATFGYVCNCDGGWSQFHVGDSFRFLPCVVPNCSVNYKCFDDSETPAAPPEPPHITNLSDLCSYAYCGGGNCVRNSTFGHRCECHEGYSNLLNITSFPCYRDCSFGADCSDLGISLYNSSSSSSQPSLSSRGRFAPCSLFWMGSSLGISIVMALMR
ncbi:uncharacterized protein LOC141823475 isoform X2 [Curcuma longa]|uniref:uncharacterized protein LOC141823475 isoform X2 n=1 Tax=Curcuma longa TaxID=136217 RepID=UPI003D9E5A75